MLSNGQSWVLGLWNTDFLDFYTCIRMQEEKK